MTGTRGRRIILGIVAAYILGAMAISFVRSLPRFAEVQGVLIDVQSTEIVNADSVTLRDQNGAAHTFRVSAEVATNSEHPNSASHLRQHMMLADPVIVRYRETPNGPVAVRVFDAAEQAR